MASDRILGLVVTIGALAFIASALSLPTSFLADPLGPKPFPIMIGAVAGICGLSLLFRPDPQPDWPRLATWAQLVIAVVVLVAYAYTLKPLGFLVPTAVAAGVISFQIHPRPTTAVLTGAGLSVGLFLIFKYALGLGLVAVPKGWF